jgi:hypothetical protein
LLPVGVAGHSIAMVPERSKDIFVVQQQSYFMRKAFPNDAIDLVIAV